MTQMAELIAHVEVERVDCDAPKRAEDWTLTECRAVMRRLRDALRRRAGSALVRARAGRALGVDCQAPSPGRASQRRQQVDPLRIDLCGALHKQQAPKRGFGRQQAWSPLCIAVFAWERNTRHPR
jgi:hypothetical protein